MIMKEENRECWSCRFYRAYYTKGFCRFEKSDGGFCNRSKEQIADKHHTCELWCYNHIDRRLRKEVALKSLVEVLRSLGILCTILEEEHEENKINPIAERKK